VVTLVGLTAPYFKDAEAAREYLEQARWPNGPICPHCGTVGTAYTARKGARPGRYRCASQECRKDFTVTVGTLFESSHIPLHKWLLAAYLLCASKKGMSSHQFHRMLGVTYKTAWFMTHRLREAMSDNYFAKLGGRGKTVEADETFWGTEKAKPRTARGYEHKMKVFSLVERGGMVRSFHVPSVTGHTLLPIMKEQVAKDTKIMTDDAGQYFNVKRHFKGHGVVHHARGEYARGPIHVNTLEAFYSLLKRGLIGVYHHVSPAHLRRYAGKFDFRWNNRHLTDAQRTDVALKGIPGKRLLYRDSSEGNGSRGGAWLTGQ
jgi:transposase-like protein